MKGTYFKEKLSDILYAIHTHPENANLRLAKQAHKIAFLKNHPEIPKQYKRKFDKLLADIEKAQAFYIDKPVIHKFPHMHKTTAAKHIKLLMEMFYFLE